MFNMGFTELIVLGTIALIFIGPKQLPEVARSIAKLINELKRATSGIGSEINTLKQEAHNLRQTAEQRVRREIDRATTEVNETVEAVKADLPEKENEDKGES